jgi:hypothetical protein
MNRGGPSHEHTCPTCARFFRCTAGACASSPAYTCVCCKLDAIAARQRRHGIPLADLVEQWELDQEVDRWLAARGDDPEEET